MAEQFKEFREFEFSHSVGSQSKHNIFMVYEMIITRYNNIIIKRRQNIKKY